MPEGNCDVQRVCGRRIGDNRGRSGRWLHRAAKRPYPDQRRCQAPGWVETWAANTSLEATLAREAPKGPNPVAMLDENLITGIDLYGQHCAICHGTAKGEASASPVAKGEYPPPPQLATDGVEDDPEGYSFWMIKHGIRWTGMPSWKGSLTDQQIWTLALF